MRRAAAAVALAAFSMVMPSLAHADGASEGQAAATSLFNEARALLDAGKTAEACDKFALSLKFDKRIGTLLNLADCYEKIGKTASAFGRFNEAAALAARAQQEERAQFAKHHAAALEPKLARMTLVLRGPTPNLVIRRDEIVVDADVLGVAVPVDPGKHVIHASAPLKKSWTREVTIANEASETPVLVPVLDDDPIAIARQKQLDSLRVTESFWTGQRIAGAAVAVVGLTGIGIGTGFGITAANQWSDAKGPRHCDATGCDSIGMAEGRDAQTAGTISTIGFVSGGVLLAGGATLFLTGGHKPKTEKSAGLHFLPLAGPGTWGAAVRGEFQ